MAEQLPELCDAIEQQESLLKRTIEMIPGSPEKKVAMKDQNRIKDRLDTALSGLSKVVVSQTVTIDSLTETLPQRSNMSPSYLGEVSDVRFFNLVKRVLQPQDETESFEKTFESYDQGDNIISKDMVSRKTIEMAVLGDTDEYIEAYFSTIHLAYPFIPKTLFMEDYAKTQVQLTPRTSAQDSRLALICQFQDSNFLLRVTSTDR